MLEAEALSDRVAIIDHGRLIAIGTSNDLKSKIGGEVITIETPDKDKISSLFKKCKCCKSTKIHNGFVTIHVHDASKKVAEIIKRAEKNKIRILSTMIHKPSLEDVFLYFTGKTIREQEASVIEGMRMRRRMWRR
jgi:ABC-2 type transport system ATP-binding protein